MVNGLSPVNIRIDTTDLPLPLSNEPITATNVPNNNNTSDLNGMSLSADLVIANVSNGSRRPSLHSNINQLSLNISDSNTNSNNTPRQNPSINNENDEGSM